MSSSWDHYFMDLAKLAASRSKDQSTKLGCVIVGPDREIRSTGYNSFPRGIDDGRPVALFVGRVGETNGRENRRPLFLSLGS